MRIQLTSDLHLECIPTLRSDASFEALVLPSAPVLALCGDVGRPGSTNLRTFLRWCAARFEHVLYISGNHEAWNEDAAEEWRHHAPRTRAELVDALRADCAACGPNVHFLENEGMALRLGGETLRVLGCTLWTHIPPKAASMAASSMADYDRIAVQGGGLRAATTDDTNAWHAASVAWLAAELTAATDPVLVLTHHQPIFAAELTPPRYVGAPLNCAFASDAARQLLAAPGGERVRAWFCGHSHASGSLPVGACMVAVNAVGYTDEEVKGWMPSAVFDVR